jgi:AraC-like DNA-binding protein
VADTAAPEQVEDVSGLDRARADAEWGGTPAALGTSGATWHDLAGDRRPAAAQHLRDLARLRRVRDRIDREYAQPLDVEALARGAHMSAGHLSRAFRRAYGESPYTYLMTRRIERAMALLRRGDLSVTEVCFAVGCASLGTFSSRFTDGRCAAQHLPARRGARDRGDAVVRGETGDQSDQESRSLVTRAAASVAVMDITMHWTFLPHDDPDASLAF